MQSCERSEKLARKYQDARYIHFFFIGRSPLFVISPSKVRSAYSCRCNNDAMWDELDTMFAKTPFHCMTVLAKQTGSRGCVLCLLKIPAKQEIGLASVNSSINVSLKSGDTSHIAILFHPSLPVAADLEVCTILISLGEADPNVDHCTDSLGVVIKNRKYAIYAPQYGLATKRPQYLQINENGDIVESISKDIVAF